MMLLLYISGLLTLFYVVLIVCYLYGWISIRSFHPSSSDYTNPRSFSILVPVRNEEKVIVKCLQDIIQQRYPAHLIEIIVIDDHSTDHTTAIAKEFIASLSPEKPSVKLLHMQQDVQKRKLKKAAITCGISQAKGDYIVLTDADCERGEEWLSTIHAFVQNTDAKLVYAPVEFKAENIFEKVQALEFAGLVGIGAAAIQIKNPNMCSAANLVVEATVFEEVGGYAGNDGIASGDDEFLMHKIFKHYPNHVRFLKNEKAIVYTSANTSLKQLADQRRRWVSKSTKYENRFITAILVGAYLFNASIMVNLFLNTEIGLWQLLIKTGVEVVFLFSVLRFFKQTPYLLFLPIAELFHILYVIIIGIWANVGTYNWKGRNVT
jgi:cellulose synthase/poly-beta-1,6-N-acetylglucosamine synthase-like glycosyltransferase